MLPGAAHASTTTENLCGPVGWLVPASTCAAMHEARSCSTSTPAYRRRRRRRRRESQRLPPDTLKVAQELQLQVAQEVQPERSGSDFMRIFAF